MIQHHLVYHYTGLDDGVTYYQANVPAAYYLIRSGKILEFIEERLGSYAATVMSTIMFLGHAQISHLETIPELKPQTKHATGVDEEHDDQTNGVNGEHGDFEEQPALLHPTLKVLAAHGYIIRVREAQFQSPSDNLLEIERAIKSKPDVKDMKGKKLEAYLIEETARLVRERTDGDLTRGLMVQGVPRGAKRKHTQANGDRPNKRPRVKYAAVDEDEEEDEWAEDEYGDDTIPMDVSLTCVERGLWSDANALCLRQVNLVVRVNYAKLDVAFRNRRLVELAERDASPVTAQVYDCLLRRVEYQTSSCRETVEIPREGEEGEQYSAPIPLSAVAEDVDPQLDLAGSIGPMDPLQPLNRRGKRPLENGEDHDGPNGVPGSSSTSRTYEVDQHLCLLAQPPHNFTSKRMTSGLITWTVEFRHLARKLRHLELERMIESRYGDVALRVVRVLHAKGKLDEKRLQEISLLPFKDLRQVLASMQAGGFVDLQEVPRDAQRQPSRTIFLWFYDPDRARNSVLEDIYKAMSRCLQRIKVERNRLKEFLEKTERSDVKGNEERYLSEAELITLQQWRAKEALLLGEVARLDDMVAVLRDF